MGEGDTWILTAPVNGNNEHNNEYTTSNNACNSVYEYSHALLYEKKQVVTATVDSFRIKIACGSVVEPRIHAKHTCTSITLAKIRSVTHNLCRTASFTPCTRVT